MGFVLVNCDWLEMKPFAIRVKDSIAGEVLIINTIFNNHAEEYGRDNEDTSAITLDNYCHYTLRMSNGEMLEMDYVENEEDLPATDAGWFRGERPVTIYDGEGLVRVPLDGTYGIYDEEDDYE